MQIAGVGFALLAAIPGIIDLIYSVPPNSTGKTRGVYHGLINITVVIIFGFTWMYRQTSGAIVWVILSLDFAGFVLLTIAGWMGGTLAFRNQIGVDHRYAGAGRWKEETLEQKSGNIAAALPSELKTNQMKLLHLDGKRIVLARSEDGYAAFDDHCTHRGGSLADGDLICGVVQCPWHGSQFDVKTGEVKSGPAEKKIKTYRVSEKAGKVCVEV